MAKKEIRVADQHRTNSLSLDPGGETVRVVYLNQSDRIYDKVKNPVAYIRKIQREDTDFTITEIWIGSEIYWKKE